MDNVFKPENMARLDSEERKKLIPPESVLDLMDIKEGTIFLDIGAGTGYFAIPALRYVGEKGKVIAADISPKMLEELKIRLRGNEKNMEILLCGREKVPLPDQSADRILMAFVFHEINNKKKYLMEVKRLIIDDGTITIAEWDKVESPGPPLDIRISRLDLMKLLIGSGLSMVKYEKLNAYQYLSILKRE